MWNNAVYPQTTTINALFKQIFSENSVDIELKQTPNYLKLNFPSFYNIKDALRREYKLRYFSF